MSTTATEQSHTPGVHRYEVGVPDPDDMIVVVKMPMRMLRFFVTIARDVTGRDMTDKATGKDAIIDNDMVEFYQQMVEDVGIAPYVWPPDDVEHEANGSDLAIDGSIRWREMHEMHEMKRGVYSKRAITKGVG